MIQRSNQNLENAMLSGKSAEDVGNAYAEEVDALIASYGSRSNYMTTREG